MFSAVVRSLAADTFSGEAVDVANDADSNVVGEKLLLPEDRAVSVASVLPFFPNSSVLLSNVLSITPNSVT